MGASVSIPGHFSHPDHRARFKRANHDSLPSPCGMCQVNVETGAPARRCSEPGCPFVVHEACYRRPETLKRHHAHPQHSLTLRPTARGSQGRCSLCAQRLGAPAPMAFAYSCTIDHGCAAGGFHAHPRCCDLPRDISPPPQMHPHRLFLRSPAAGGNNSSSGRQHPRTCLQCKKTTTTGRTAAWSYQCPECDDGVELCLACVHGGDGHAVQCCGVHCCDVDLPAMSRVGQLAGAFFCGFGSVMGCPGFTTQLYTPGTWKV